MEIRKTTLADLEQVDDLYEHAKRFMAEHGNPGQWGPEYPTREIVKSDIAEGIGYVGVEDGKIVAAFVFFVGDEPTYQVIDGAWLDDRPYGVIHRLASNGTIKGVGSACIDWAIHQCGNMRIDTHENNTIMRNLLQKKGFQYCGVVWMADGTPRFAYQRLA